MKLDEIAASLPNGFHDAELIRFAIDYTKREARLTLNIWVAADLQNADEREAYRPAEVTLYGLLFWVSEPPDAGSSYQEAGAHRIDIGPMESLNEKNLVRLPPVRAGAFVNWIFVRDWNAFIYVAAEDAGLDWLGDRTIRHHPSLT